ncbi:MAG: hypothetical protein DRJ03_10250 [Chloroflexi bacterium]|nr:MAG: hypothetical protein B6I35_01410 [Anaerolineaceae bacterium 4572_32.2]RLC80285.1 MAG: hypothetical protein DRI81_04290 [Chloroflexota bacterium]RLC85922.1 MAG: hypothetical protein DRJ03_10250 [Chloroflexota bacterium]HEY72066.1 hypothetical protein [Thermoflexia bacterium]
MKQGLLWYDDNPGRDLADKVRQAARRYRQKFGAAPDICYVHPLALNGNGNGKGQKVGRVCVSPLPSVLRHHFWLGQEEQAQTRAR